MRLLSLIVRNYRVHRELRVEFAPGSTLIGGPNESGKSTLAEAAHRGLFLKAKISGENRAAMLSRHGGQPEVTVRFEQGGRIYEILKRFAGATGSAVLTETGGAVWNNEEAEQKLAELLGVAGPISGRGADSLLRQQWAHLWVWQGQSGGDLADYAADQRDALIQRLQSSGGAAVAQSDRDARVARRFAAECDALFLQNGQIRAGTDLHRAEKEKLSAGADADAARTTLQKLEQAVEDCDAAQARIAAANERLPELDARLTGTVARLAVARDLANAVQVQALDLQIQTGEYQNLAAAEAEIRRLRARLAEAESTLGPQRETMARLAQLAEDAAAKLKHATETRAAAARASQAARATRDAAQACLTHQEKHDTLEGLLMQARQVEARRTEKSSLEQELATLPAITTTDVARLHKLQDACSRAEAALQAMATGIEVLASDVPVQVGDTHLPPGRAEILLESTVLAIGGTRVRISPGGGSSLRDARAKAESDARALAGALASLGVPDAEAAATAALRRQLLGQKISQETSLLASLGADDLDARLIDARAAVGQAIARRDAQLAAAPDFSIPADAAAARAALDAANAGMKSLEQIEAGLTRDVKKATSQHEAAAAQLADLRAHLAVAEREAHQDSIKLGLLVSSHGEDAARAARLADLQAGAERATAQLAESRAQLAGLQPDLLELDRRRLEQAVAVQQSDLQDARSRLAAAQALLRNAGTDDPHAACLHARARADRAAESFDALWRRAKAIEKLAVLFREQEQLLADRLAAPFAEKISAYLQCLFGPDTTASVTMDDTEIGGLALCRHRDGGAAFPFSQLSGGAREQTAAAARLAMAEILAENHGGTLPVVFDDAFAYSDPERVQALQRMLYRAAARGLQVIVLACNPADYAGLGAATIALDQPS
jgi:DNA repair exonuclease SbcCD ATPase subunit